MIDKICKYILKKMQNKMPEIDEEKSEIILYGIQLIIGEIPKLFILFGLSFLLGIGWYTILAFVLMTPYRAASGGFHLKSHLGCIIGTILFYCGNVLISKYLFLTSIAKYILVIIALLFGIAMVSLYAPADTESVPIISHKQRKTKKILSYISLILTLVAALLIKDRILSNILIVGTIIQTIMITRLAYRITNNKYGHEVYNT